MKKILATLLLCVTTAWHTQAQTLSHTFNDVSFSEALKYIQAQSHDFTIAFIYNELEDFRVSTELKDVSIPDAIQQIIGYYPIRMTVDGRSIYVECTDKAERHLHGIIVDEKHRPIAYASIVLMQPTDSVVITHGVSNEDGHFVIPFHQHEVLVGISCLGYKKYYATCSEEDMGTISLQSEEYFINGVVVKGEHILHYVDKSVHTFTDQQIAQARNVRDLLEHVEDLQIDPISNRICRMNGGSVTLLLNGIRASDTDLKSIPPDKIVRVEYYNVPPARYSDASTVVNVVTKRLDNGFGLGIDLTHAFTTGFGNDDAYFTYTSGRHQLQASYSLNLREYKDDQGESSFHYQLNGQQNDYIERHKRSFGYRGHNPVLKYTYNRPEDLAVQVTASPSLCTRHDHRHVDIDLLEGSVDSQGEGRSHYHSYEFNPSVNGYLQKHLPHHQELDVDLTLTYFHNRYELDNDKQRLGDGSSLLYDHQRQTSNKRSIGGEVAYTKEWGTTSLQTGYRFSYGKSKATLSNVLSDFQDYRYSSASTTHRFYAEFGGRLSSLMYRIGTSVTQVRTANDDTHTSKWAFMPQLVITYNPSQQTSLQFTSSTWTDTPTISQLSNNTTLILPGVASKGNPYLRPSTHYANNLNLRWDTPSLYLSFALTQRYVHHPINSYYTESILGGKPYLINMQENANYESSYGFDYGLTWRPLANNLLTLTLSGLVHRRTIDSPITGHYHHTYAPLVWRVQFQHASWGITYIGRIVSSQLNGSQLTYDENGQNLLAFWQKKGWRVTTGCYWLFTRARYSSESVPTSLLQFHRKNWINDNASMFVIGISWDFTSGKDYRIQKKLDTTDHDSGLFR